MINCYRIINGKAEVGAFEELQTGWTEYTLGAEPAILTNAINNPQLNSEELVLAIKAKAGELILARMPEWRQRNYLARRLELSEIATPTQAELDEMAFIDGEWAYAKGIRNTSNIAETNLTPLADIVW